MWIYNTAFELFLQYKTKNVADLHLNTVLGYTMLENVCEWHSFPGYTQKVYMQSSILSQSFLYFLLQGQVRRRVAGTGSSFQADRAILFG